MITGMASHRREPGMYSQEEEEFENDEVDKNWLEELEDIDIDLDNLDETKLVADNLAL